MEIRGQQLKKELIEIYKADSCVDKLNFLIIFSPLLKENDYYVKSVIKTLTALGIKYTAIPVATFDQAKSAILNHDLFTTILVARPLGIAGEKMLLENIPGEKDVDNLCARNIGLLHNGDIEYLPATAKAVKLLLEHLDFPIVGKRALVIGRSTSVGAPIAFYLSCKNATVTLCHSFTPPSTIKSLAKEADIIVLATGHRLLEQDDLKPNSLIIDCGFNSKGEGDLGFIPQGVDYTPVPGGVGPLTTISLVGNAIYNYKKSIN